VVDFCMEFCSGILIIVSELFIFEECSCVCVQDCGIEISRQYDCIIGGRTV
jgi:hypothetical protein